jgi:hypothetical protein
VCFSQLVVANTRECGDPSDSENATKGSQSRGRRLDSDADTKHLHVPATECSGMVGRKDMKFHLELTSFAGQPPSLLW